MQFYVETIKQMDDILGRYNLSTTESSIYQIMLDTSFFEVTEPSYLEIYKTAWEEKKTIDISSLNTKDKRTFVILLRHLTQIISKKYRWDKKYNYRDRKMGENILVHLKEDALVKGFFWAHNLHMAKFIYKEGKSKERISVGGLLKREIGHQYFAIGQDFDEGAFCLFPR